MEDTRLDYNKPGIAYKLLKLYVRIVYSKFYFRKTYYLNKELVPHDCPLIVVSDHQNSLNDALGLVFAINSRGNRKLRAFTRADAFDHSFLRIILKGIGLMPAFRLEYQGLENVSKNGDIFGEAQHELLNKGTIIIFPEANHVGKRTLRKFSQGYLRLLFDAAEACDYKKEMFVLPACNHYSDYIKNRGEVLIKFGEPVSLAPYYEQYKEKPKTTLREINKLVQQKVSKLMLDITDVDNYEAIDYLRNTYGGRFALIKGLDYQILPEKLHADKLLVESLDKLKIDNQEQVTGIYEQVRVLEQETKNLKIKDEYFDTPPSSLFFTVCGLILLFPLFLLSWLLNWLIIYVPRLFTRKIDDVILHGAVKMITSILVTIPLQYLLNLFLFWFITDSFIIAFMCLICLPFLYIFMKHYIIVLNNCKSKIRFLKLLRKEKLKELNLLRNNIWKSLDNLFKAPDL